MSYVGIVLISHSEKVASGVKEIIRQVIHEVPLEAAGGTDDGDIGTSVEKIGNAINHVYGDKGVLLFYDLGSAKMNAEIAIEMAGKDNIKIVDAPLLEGAYVGAVESNMGKTSDEIIASVTKSFPQVY